MCGHTKEFLRAVFNDDFIKFNMQFVILLAHVDYSNGIESKLNF